MSTSNAHAAWRGRIKEGKGTMKFTGYEGACTLASSFENAGGTNAEELVGAAHAGCYSMYLSLLLTQEGLNPESIDTSTQVTIDKYEIGPHISKIDIHCQVDCVGLTGSKLDELAAIAKEKCPVSRLYAGGTATIVARGQLIEYGKV